MTRGFIQAKEMKVSMIRNIGTSPSTRAFASQTASFNTTTGQPTTRLPQRPVLGGLFDLGPSSGAAGCGSAGTTAVPDRIGPYELTAACEAHDACSDPLFNRSDKSLGDVLECQSEFARNIYATNNGSFLSRVGAGLISGIYTAATGTVGLLQWAGNRIVDCASYVGSAVSGIGPAIGSFFNSLFS